MRAIPLLALAPLALAGCFLWRSAEAPPAPAAPEPPQAAVPEPPDLAPPAEAVAQPEPATPPAPPQPGPIQLTLRASDKLNPDERGQPLPTVVVVYQLRSANKIAGADADDLYRKPKEVLGEDLLQSDELQLAPGQVQTRTLERDKGAKALAVVALVRRPKGPAFRSIVELPALEQAAELSFLLDGYRVERQ
jgi:type VI secretion system VasD/TssJ family lipoprotein